MIKIAVCDDDIQMVHQIDGYLTQIQKEENLQFQVYYYSSGEELLAHMPRNINILLLDVKMGKTTGIEAARALREEGADFYLFFITSNTQYALEGYSVHAYAFLCKPLQYVHLKNYIMEVVATIKRTKPIRIELKSKSEVHFVDCQTLVYAEVYGHTTIVSFDDGTKIKTKAPLDELEKKLTNHGFFRCHKSYLINLSKVKSIRTGEIVMSDDAVIPLSRNRKQEFLLAFHEDVGEWI